MGIGDIHTTNDGAIIIFDEQFDTVEFFVFPGQKYNMHLVFELYLDGAYDSEISYLKDTAIALQLKFEVIYKGRPIDYLRLYNSNNFVE